MTYIYTQVPKLAVKKVTIVDVDKLETNKSTEPASDYKYFFYDFIHSGCCGMMIAYSFLYLTVLSFGSLMIVYLRWVRYSPVTHSLTHLLTYTYIQAGISDSLIGASRGVAAIVEIVGASYLYPYFTYHVGVHKAGTLAIWYQCGFVAIAAFSFSFASLDLHDSAKVLIVAVLLSRAGLWMFDRCATQIGQETIKEEVRGIVNSQWTAMFSAFEMLVYIFAMVYYDPSYFYILTTISFIMVFAAAVVYTITSSSTPSTLYSQLQNYGAVN
jgi:iron-regulated transporter 1